MRVFEVPEPVGPWITVLVYLPRNRFTAELPERIADTVARAYGADRRTFEPHLGASSLARITVSVRCPDAAVARRPRRARAHRRRAVDVVVRPAAAVLVADVGEVEAAGCSTASVPTRRRRTARPCRRSGPSTTSGASPTCSPATTR